MVTKYVQWLRDMKPPSACHVSKYSKNAKASDQGSCLALETAVTDLSMPNFKVITYSPHECSQFGVFQPPSVGAKMALHSLSNLPQISTSKSQYWSGSRRIVVEHASVFSIAVCPPFFTTAA